MRLIDLLGFVAALVMVDTCSFPWNHYFFEHFLLVTPVFALSTSFCLVQTSQSLQT